MRIAARVKPGSAHTRVGGNLGGALVVRVTARAVDGKATEAALRALAAALGLRRADVSLVTGATSRTKLIDVTSSTYSDADLAGRVAVLLGPDLS